MRRNPKERISAYEALQHEWFKDKQHGNWEPNNALMDKRLS
jgi:hypothetical protein